MHSPMKDPSANMQEHLDLSSFSQIVMSLGWRQILILPQRQVSKRLQSINLEIDSTDSKIPIWQRHLNPKGLQTTLFIANKRWKITCLQLPDKSALGILLFLTNIKTVPAILNNTLQFCQSTSTSTCRNSCSKQCLSGNKFFKKCKFCKQIVRQTRIDNKSFLEI